jgi:hypothetical protein
MKKNLGFIVIVLVFILMFIFQVMWNRRDERQFYARTNEDINTLEMRLRRDGAPPDQVGSISSALISIRTDVADYVDARTGPLNYEILILGILLMVVIYKVDYRERK